MCEIIEHTDPLEARDLLLSGLLGLEYRGYDSTRITYFNTASQVEVVRKVGGVATLGEYIKKTGSAPRCGVGHTRWATHGGITDKNTHPHCVEQVILIHDGIIENCHQLVEEYRIRSRLVSQADGKVAIWVLDAVYEECNHDPLIAIGTFVKRLGGFYGFCILFGDRPGETYAVYSVSPLITSYTQSGAMMASDPAVLISLTKEYLVVPEHRVLHLAPYRIQVYNAGCSRIQSGILGVNWNMGAAMKDGFPHLMLKETHKQPEALKNTVFPRLAEGLPGFTPDGIPDELFADCRRIRAIARETAMHAGMVVKALIEPLLRIPVTVSIAPEFRYEDPPIDKSILVIIIFRSGETIDTLVAMRLVRSLGSRTLSIIGVKGSAIARESDRMLHTHAGPEIAMASTKTYSVQLATLCMFCYRVAFSRERCNEMDTKEFVEDLLAVIPAMESMTGQPSHIKSFICYPIYKRDTFFIGGGLSYTFSLEGALKLKRVSYIHAEAYATGELKHRTITPIYDSVPVIAIATQDRIFAKIISNIREVKTRGVYVILLAKEQAAIKNGVSGAELRIPDLEDRFTVFPITVTLQLTAYYASVSKNLSVDQPCNLIKSVTVG